jgi:hypothetical protein
MATISCITHDPVDMCVQKRVEGAPKVKHEDNVPASPSREAADCAAPSSAPVQTAVGAPVQASTPGVQSVGEREAAPAVHGQSGARNAKNHNAEPGATTPVAEGSRPQSETGGVALANGSAPSSGARPAVRILSCSTHVMTRVTYSEPAMPVELPSHHTFVRSFCVYV